MGDRETIELNRCGWDTISDQYQIGTRISTDDVHYGPLGLGERELGLLGDVDSKKIIEIGCGGGQNGIVLAKWGARVVGVDPSKAQLEYARRLARKEGVRVRFVQGVAEDLSAFPDRSFDIALSSYAFDYVTDLTAAYSEAKRVLKPRGLFVFCLGHPWFGAVGWYLAGDVDEPEVRDYGSWPAQDEWDWSYPDGTKARMRDHFRTLAQIINELIGAGFLLERLVEQVYEDVADGSPENLGRLPYVHEIDVRSKEYVIGRKLPRTLILRARKA